jgi:integrase/recombinase XerD
MLSENTCMADANKPNIERKKVILSPTRHRGAEVVSVQFDKDAALIRQAKALPGISWSQSRKFWYQDAAQFRLSDVFKVFRGLAWVDYAKLSEFSVAPTLTTIPRRHQYAEKATASATHLQTFQRWLLHKRYSASTISTYTGALQCFLRRLGDRPADSVTHDEVVAYVNEHILANRLSYSYQNQLINTLKLFYGQVMHSKLDVGTLDRPRREYKLPNVLSKKEVKSLLNALVNQKHRTMLSLIYACGLRRSELLNLKLADIPQYKRQKRQGSANFGQDDRDAEGVLLEIQAKGLVV